MFDLTDQEKKMLLFILVIVGTGVALRVSLRLAPGGARALCVLESDTFYPRVNVNTASREVLVAVPYIGLVTAERIISARRMAGPFRSAEDLARAGLGGAAIRRVGKYLSF